eukprot:3515855-Alexandrium_andersonii.AAC.1
MADIRGMLVTARYGMRNQAQGAGLRPERGGGAAIGQSKTATGTLRFCGACYDGHRGGGWREAREK